LPAATTGQQALCRDGLAIAGGIDVHKALVVACLRIQEGRHVLRHTFCSHLAMRGAPARAIQELAGHQDLGTTQRYMHLSPAALDAAIRLLETGTETSRWPWLASRSSQGD
jgi:site-specific recombinase XerD